MNPSKSFRPRSRPVVLAALALLVVAACDASPTNVPSAPAAASIAVTITPPSTATEACQSVPFKGTVTGTVNQGITWSVKEGPAGGTITAEGVYTAPSVPGTYHVVATSAADSTRVVEGAVAVGPERVLSLAVTPASASVVAGGSQAFSAVVTTSCGTFAAQ